MDAELCIALAITHTPWRPERVRTMERLRRMLGVHDGSAGDYVGAYREFTERAANHEWSHAMWSWGASTGAEWCLFLQDDVVVPPDFWPELCAMLAAVPGKVVGLHAVHPGTATLSKSGLRWMTTWDGLVGVGYAMPRDELARFLRWRATCLHEGAVEAINEDTLIGCWSFATGRRVWHPMPTIIDHDTSILSTYGNDSDLHRRPRVTWANAPAGSDLASEAWWRAGLEQVPNLRLFNAATPSLVERWVFRANEVCLDDDR